MAPDVLQKLLVDHAGLGFNDGRTFRSGGEGFQRMNVACPRSTVAEAMEKMKTAIRKNIPL
jgi:cystathionine beta-lyase